MRLFDQLEAAPKEQLIILSSLGKKKKKPTLEAESTSFVESVSDEKYQLIAMDSFRLLADWFHYAIMELTSIKDFKYDFTWIANQLGISVTEARQATERLIRLEILEEKRGALIKTSAFVTNYVEGQTNSALKQLQRHVLQKALEAVDTVPAQSKDITSVTMAIDVKKIPEAKRRIKAFRRKLSEFLEDGNQTQVFNLGVQLYPVSKGPTQ